MKRFVLLACTSVFALGLVACGKDASEPASEASIARQTSDPAKSVEAIASKLKNNELLEMIQLSVPPAKLDELRAEFKAKMQEDVPSEEDRGKFSEQVARFTAPGAEETLYAELEPLLVKFENEMAAQMPMMIGMGQGFAVQSIQANEDISPAEKEQAMEMVSGLATWLQTAKFTDRDLAKKGIAIAVSTARKMELKTLDEMRAMEFDQAVGKASIAFGGIKEVLALYGLDVNKSLDSVKATIVSEANDVAKVAYSYNFFDKALKSEIELVKVDGRWYGKDSLEQLIQGLAVGEDEVEGDFIEDEEFVTEEEIAE